MQYDSYSNSPWNMMLTHTAKQYKSISNDTGNDFSREKILYSSTFNNMDETAQYIIY